jgi:hypothetical protein
MAHRSEGMPGWFPFALTASFLVMLAAGAKSGWRLAGGAPPPPPPPPPSPAPASVQQAGILHDWAGVEPPQRQRGAYNAATRV